MSDREPFDLVLAGGAVVTERGVSEADVGVRGGRIVALGTLATRSAVERIDARGLHVLPGVVDSQVHFREPGLEHKESIESGTAAAALGGVTTVLEMPNTDPPTTTDAALADKIARVAGRAWTDIAFFVGAAEDNVRQLGRLERLPGCAGVKLFMGSSTGSLLVSGDAGLDEVMRHGRRRVAVHAEDEARLRERRHIADAAGADCRAHPLWRDVESALRATQRCLASARRHGRRVHVLHATTAEEMSFLARHRDLATVEVTPQHLTFAAPDCYERLGSRAQVNPPIRSAEHRDALWEALRSGVVDVIGSDHAPHTLEEKARPYPGSPSGMPGVQTLLSVMLTHCSQGRLLLSRLVDLLCAAPARVYGIAFKGRIAVGMDADFALVDLWRSVRLSDQMMRSRCGWTPYAGMEVTGVPVATVLRGRPVMRDGELLGEPTGRPVRFTETRTGAEPQQGHRASAS